MLLEKEEQMEKYEAVSLASIVIGKGYSYETMKYSDYLYGREDSIDDVWEYVIECQDFGKIAFYKKYKDYKLY